MVENETRIGDWFRIKLDENGNPSEYSDRRPYLHEVAQMHSISLIVTRPDEVLRVVQEACQMHMKIPDDTLLHLRKLTQEREADYVARQDYKKANFPDSKTMDDFLKAERELMHEEIEHSGRISPPIMSGYWTEYDVHYFASVKSELRFYLERALGPDSGLHPLMLDIFQKERSGGGHGFSTNMYRWINRYSDILHDAACGNFARRYFPYYDQIIISEVGSFNDGRHSQVYGYGAGGKMLFELENGRIYSYNYLEKKTENHQCVGECTYSSHVDKVPLEENKYPDILKVLRARGIARFGHEHAYGGRKKPEGGAPDWIKKLAR
jgi:hypothetical protein